MKKTSMDEVEFEESKVKRPRLKKMTPSEENKLIRSTFKEATEHKSKTTKKKERKQMFKIKSTTKSAIISVLVTLAVLGVFVLGALTGTKIQQAIDKHTKNQATELVTQLKTEQ